MAQPVFSKQFLSQQGLSGNGPTITVPPGHVYIVKQLTVYGNTIFGAWSGIFQDVVSGAALFSGGHANLSAAWFGLYGALVFEEGGQFRWQAFTTGTDSIDVSASGYDLTA